MDYNFLNDPLWFPSIHGYYCRAIHGANLKRPSSNLRRHAGGVQSFGIGRPASIVQLFGEGIVAQFPVVSIYNDGCQLLMKYVGIRKL